MKSNNRQLLRDLEILRKQFGDLMEPEYSRLILSSVAGTRTSNSRYHCAVYTSEKISLIEKSKSQSITFAFDFNTHEFDSTATNSLENLGNFAQKLHELLEKAQKGKATILKKH